MFDVLQQNSDNRCSPESWSSLLTSLLAETKEVAVHLDSPSKRTINARFKRRETHRMFSGVLSCTDTKTWS